MANVRVNTCIVGGGPAGLMLGLLLAKRGADVLVREPAGRNNRKFGVVGVFKNRSGLLRTGGRDNGSRLDAVNSEFA